MCPHCHIPKEDWDATSFMGKNKSGPLSVAASQVRGVCNVAANSHPYKVFETVAEARLRNVGELRRPDMFTVTVTATSASEELGKRCGNSQYSLPG